MPARRRITRLQNGLSRNTPTARDTAGSPLRTLPAQAHSGLARARTDVRTGYGVTFDTVNGARVPIAEPRCY